MIKVSAVSYLNTLPFISGLQASDINYLLDLQLDVPALTAKRFLENEVDIALVPVAALPELPEYHFFSDYCIGCDGAVGSVGILSREEVPTLDTVIMDRQSISSVALTKILYAEHWKKNPDFINAFPNYESMLKAGQGALIIGDRAIKYRSYFPFWTDLGLEWKKHTGLPFVFAVWISRTELSPEIKKAFNTAFRMGLEGIDELDLPREKKQYLNEFISYEMDKRKHLSLETFLEKIAVNKYCDLH